MPLLPRLIPPAVVFALGITTLNAASAAIVDRTETVMPAENCQPALPAYDGSIRKRPLAVQNEGGAIAFVTCGMKGAFAARPINRMVTITLVNTTPTPVAATCTLVDGRDLALSTPVFIPLTRTLSPAMPSTYFWSPANNGGANFIYPALSCGLPPGIGISSSARVYQYDD